MAEVRFDIPLDPPSAVVGRAHFGEAQSGLRVEPAVPACRTKSPLEGGNGRGLGACRDAIADGGQIGERTGKLDNPDAAAAAVGEVDRGLRPDPNTGAREPGPVQELSRV